MTRRMRIIAGGVVALVLAAGLWWAWQNWEPFLKYREKRLVRAYNAEIRRYLQGSDSLDVASRRLAQVILKLGFVIDRQQWIADEGGSGGSMTITTMASSSDIPKDDPRVEELVLNAFKLAIPPGASEAFRTRSGEMWDSVIHSRGYRSVR